MEHAKSIQYLSELHRRYGVAKLELVNCYFI